MTTADALSLPETLYRVTKVQYKVDSEGYILSHEGCEKGYEPRILPFCHQKDWKLSARLFAFPYEQKPKTEQTIDLIAFRLLTVKTENVEDLDIDHLTRTACFQFEGGEYLCKVKKNNLISDGLYRWEKILLSDSKEKKEEEHIPEWLFEAFPDLVKTLGWEPVFSPYLERIFL
jgi:hypothetical protein